LYKCLEPFAKRNISLVKIESRPIINTHWQFTFYIDVKADVDSIEFTEAMNDLSKLVSRVRVLGSYTKGEYIPT